MSEPLHLGFDYSLKSPGLCIDGKHLSFINDNDSYVGNWKKNGFTITGHSFGEIIGDAGMDYTVRCVKAANVFRKEIEKHLDGRTPGVAAFEAYAISKMRGGQNRMIQIAESTGLMKAICSMMGFSIAPYMPNTVKSTAGHGHAKKDQMADFFEAKHGFHIHELLDCGKGDNPSGDLIDAYYVWETGVTKL